MGDLFALSAWSPPPCTYISCISVFPAWILTTPMYLPPLPCTYIPCMGSIPCVDDLFALRALIPPCIYIPCISLCGSPCGSPPLPCTYIPCVSLHGFQFPGWFPVFTACPSSHLCVILTQPDILYRRDHGVSTEFNSCTHSLQKIIALNLLTDQSTQWTTGQYVIFPSGIFNHRPNT